jgi:GNAT superfamily N-acetyltransferase
VALKDGYTDIPPGKIAAVVTQLQMLAPPPPRQTPLLSGISIRTVTTPEAGWYRDLYSRIGAVDWLWFSRLQLSASALETIIRHPRVEIYARTADDRDEGLLELDFRTAGECELAFFGMTSGLIGQGAGRLLMNKGIERAWSQPIRRFRVHTCTLDHPGTLAFYMRTGFKPYQQQVEIADDPRLSGLIPETAAAHVPIIRP